MPPLALLFGFVVGASLGLTGGGGAILAVPLLVYGLQVPPREAIGISLTSVGAMAFVGFLHRWRLREVEIRAGLAFAVAGMLGAPIGARVAALLPERALLIAMAALMGIMAWRLWWKPSEAPGSGDVKERQFDGVSTRPCTSAPSYLTSQCASLLLIGLATGVLSGLFGVGGGFVIVPSLMLFSSLSFHRAVGTSLLAIALVSASGLAVQFADGQSIRLALTLLFVVGGLGGLVAGQRLGRRLSGPSLQRLFAVAIVVTACFVVAKNLGAYVAT